MFQSTLPRGERLVKLIIHAPVVCFNPRSRAGSDGFIPADKGKGWEFQSTLPRGERPEEFTDRILIVKFQSTLPRGERRVMG